VPAFTQYDSDDTTILSDRDIKRRWSKFHGTIRLVQGNIFQRVVGRMLGEDTIRYKVARFFGRPLLKFMRRVRRKPQVASLERPTEKPVYFPHNYRPPANAKQDDEHPLVAPNDVQIVAVNEVDSAPTATIAALNDVVTRTRATWLFIVDESVGVLDRLEAANTLRASALEGDDVVFADESGVDPRAPILKSSAVGVHTLLSYNCVGRPALLRVATLRQLAGFATKAGWAFEHDLYLRLVEHGAHFRHVAKVLVAGRPTISFDAQHIGKDSQQVVRNALVRRGWKGTVAPGAFGSSVDWRLAPPSPAPSIDIIIPTRDRIDLVRRCIDAIEEKSTFSNYDIILLDNDSIEQASLDYFAATKYRVVPCPGPFNYAAIVNKGVRHSSADFVVTLNNDTILVTPDWLEQMVGLASLPDVSIVGACLLDQDGHHEHDSIVVAPYPQHLRIDSNYPHLDQFSTSIRDVAAVTGAIQMVRRDLWESLGGMDELLKVTMNDVDICLRSQADGRYVVYTPDVQLFHHVSSSRGSLDPLEDRNRFIRRWDIFGSFRDPYFPESLLLLGETVYYRHR
jgi:GT2 family glycosyltransferase